MTMTSSTTTDNGTTERNKQLLQGVQYLWEAGLLSDATLETEDGHRFPVHRVVLAAVSDYFMAMFTQDMQERLSTRSICLKGVRGEVLEVLLRYVYTGELRLLQGTVSEVASAAGYLQLECALVNCFHFAMTAIDIGNCVEVYNMAKMYKVRVADIGDELEEKALQFICGHFQQVLASGTHNRLDSDTIIRCLELKDEDGVDNVTVGPEIELFQHIATWCRVNDTAGEALRAIRFPLMTPLELDLVQNVVKSEGFKCEDLIQEAQSYVKLPMLNQVGICRPERYKVRNRPCIVTLAHDGSYKNLRLFILSTAEGCPPPAEQKKTLTWMQVPQLNQGLHEDMVAGGFRPHSWAVVKGFLVVHGQIHPGYHRCFVFDPRTLEWKTMPAMNISRTQCPLVECCGELFALGGVNSEEGGMVSGIIERFDFETCQWSVVGQMEVPLEGHGACSVSDRIYVFGGRQANHRASHGTYSYEPGSGTWTEHHSLTALPKDNSLQLHSLLSRIYSGESSAWGMTHFQSQDDPKASPTQGKKHGSTSKSHFAVVLPDSVYFIGATLPEVNRREKRNAHKSTNVNKCVQVIAKEKYGLGDSISQPDYPKGWQPCLAVGLSLPWDIVKQAQPLV